MDFSTNWLLAIVGVFILTAIFKLGSAGRYIILALIGSVIGFETGLIIGEQVITLSLAGALLGLVVAYFVGSRFKLEVKSTSTDFAHPAKWSKKFRLMLALLFLLLVSLLSLALYLGNYEVIYSLILELIGLVIFTILVRFFSLLSK